MKRNLVLFICFVWPGLLFAQSSSLGDVNGNGSAGINDARLKE